MTRFDDRLFDARPDTVDFRDTMYVPTLTEVPEYRKLPEYQAAKVPILDQGKEGACTDRKSTRLNSSHIQKSRMPSSA